MGSTTENIVTALITGLANPALDDKKVLPFAKALHYHVSSPRVTVVPIGGPILTPDNPGHGKVDPNTKARIIFHRKCLFEVYVMGQNDDQTETLLHEVLRVLRGEYQIAAVMGKETWLTGDPNVDGVVLDGTAVMFEMTMTLPVYDIQRPLKLLTATPPIQGTDLWGKNEEDVSCNPAP